MKQLIKKQWFIVTVIIMVVIGVVYSMIYIDVVSRAREAYNEGEKYWLWHEQPAEKKEFLQAELKKKLSVIEKKFSRGKIDKTQYEQDIQISKFNFQEALEESSIKYAYVWYQTAVELFSPPESKWVRLSREKMLRAKELWKEELRAKNIPFEDYMLE